jgi:processive rubber oxygenase RoxA-like protein
MRYWLTCFVTCLVFPAVTDCSRSDNAEAARGRAALLEHSYTPAIWSLKAYDEAWKQWGVAEKPAEYAKAFRERYGLHAAPYPNDDLPMGLRQANGLLGKGIATDCLLCHGGSILGKSIIGLPNTALDMHSLYEDLARTDRRPTGPTFTFTNVRGTTEAGAMAVFLLDYRDENLNLRLPQKLAFRTDLCEDPPAWWLLKKKRTMYHTGSNHARSVRSIMQFMMTPLNSAEYVKKQEPAFRDIQAFLLSIEPPKYPFPIDQSLAAKGKILFEQTCSRCHGTYGPNGTYPNKIIPLDEIGTDSVRARGFTPELIAHYNKSWFAEEQGPDGERYRATSPQGYQAPPLDGIWATAPYFHNASVPTVYHVLNSKARPQLFTRSYRTNEEDFDKEKLGWKFIEHDRIPLDATPFEKRQYYNTREPGRGNRGHTFGDKFTEAERLEVIEYLKTL